MFMSNKNGDVWFDPTKVMCIVGEVHYGTDGWYLQITATMVSGDRYGIDAVVLENCEGYTPGSNKLAYIKAWKVRIENAARRSHENTTRN